MNKQEFDSLIQDCPPEVSTKGILLFNGVVSCAAAYQVDSSLNNLRAWQAAEAALAEFINNLTANKSDSSACFRNRVAVFQYLRSQNIKIGRSKLYQDADSGKLRMQRDGSILQSDVDIYIRAFLSPKQKAAAYADINVLQKEKLEKENKKLDEQIAKLAWDREREAGKYLLRSDFEMELAARAAVLQTSLRQMAQTKVYDWIAVCRGDHGKASDVAAMIAAEIDTVLNDYATTDRFQVIFVKEPTESTHEGDSQCSAES